MWIYDMVFMSYQGSFDTRFHKIGAKDCHIITGTIINLPQLSL